MTAQHDAAPDKEASATKLGNFLYIGRLSSTFSPDENLPKITLHAESWFISEKNATILGVFESMTNRLSCGMCSGADIPLDTRCKGTRCNLWQASVYCLPGNSFSSHSNKITRKLCNHYLPMLSCTCCTILILCRCHHSWAATLGHFGDSTTHLELIQ